MKVGRNDPCPCNSGKKYKKCCLAKDEQIIKSQLLDKTVTSPKPDIDGWEPESEVRRYHSYEDQDDDQDEDQNENWSYEKNDVEPNNDPEDELSEISEEDKKLVDDWWEEMNQINDPVKAREHIILFIDQYPHLVEHLELYWDEVLCDLSGDHFQLGVYENFVELLLRIRKDFPNVYKQDYEYYDNELIYWYTVQGRLDEIDTFFDLYRKYYNSASHDQLERSVLFLRANNHSNVLLTSLANSACREYVKSVIGNNILSKYFDKPITEESAKSLLHELKLEGIATKKITEKVINERLMLHTRPFTAWDENLPKKRSQAHSYYLSIANNFAYFLYKNTVLSFDSALIFADTIIEYYNPIVSSSRRPVETFCLDEILFRKYFHIYNQVWIDSIFVSYVQLNAFYFFVAYLKKCGNISEDQKRDIQGILTKIWEDNYSDDKTAGTEMIPFERFPLWEIEE